MTRDHKNAERRTPPSIKAVAALSAVALSAFSAHAEIHVTPPPLHGAGHTSVQSWMDAHVRGFLQDADAPGATVAVSRNGRIIYSRGAGYRELSASGGAFQPMRNYNRSRIGSNTKVVTTIGILKVMEQQPSITPNTYVYGPNGVLTNSFWRNDQKDAARRHNPIVGTAIGANNRTLTWYSDGKYTVGKTDDLDHHAGPAAFSTAPGQSPATITAIARGGAQNNVYAWYDDGSLSIGNPSDLDAVIYFKEGQQIFGTEFSGYKVSDTHSRDMIAGIAMSTSDDTTYTWYHDGRVSRGEPLDLAQPWHGVETKSYSTIGSDFNRSYRIVGMARSINGTTVAWYEDERASKGSSTDLDQQRGLYAYSRRRIPGSISTTMSWFDQTRIKHLLSHTSGMTRSGQREHADRKYPFAVGDPDYRWSHRYVLSTRKRLFAPGADYAYSNHGLGLTGYLIEVLTGDRYDIFLKENILDPLGLTNFIPHGLNGYNFRDASEYFRDSAGNYVAIEQDAPVEVHSGAGSHSASAHDVLKLLLATDGRSNRPDILTSQSLDRMQTRTPGVDVNVGLGWHMWCNRSDCLENGSNGIAYQHHGKTGGARSFMVKFDNYRSGNVMIDDVNVVINVNASDVEGDALEELAVDLGLIAAISNTGSYDLYDSLD